MENIKLTAKVAREISDTTNSFSNHIYKTIRETAKDGRTSLYWSVDNVSTVLIKNTIEDLENNGFTVEKYYYHSNDADELEEPILDTLKISW